MNRQELIEKLEKLSQGKTIIPENRDAIKTAIRLLQSGWISDDICIALINEYKRGIDMTETLIKDTKSEMSEMIMRGYVCGLAYCADLLKGKNPKSLISTVEETEKAIERAKDS